MNGKDQFFALRSFLLANRQDLQRAREGFQWKEPQTFNWALDYFDSIAEHNSSPALILADSQRRREEFSFQDLSLRSNQVANFLVRIGVRKGDVVLVMLPAIAPLWEISLALMKIGAVLSPSTTLLPARDCAERIQRAGIRHVFVESSLIESLESEGAFSAVDQKVGVGHTLPGWISYDDSKRESHEFLPRDLTTPRDPLLLYFTSGTTAQPKMVVHNHQSYPVGHLSTMYWLGIQPNDVHYNISSPGWAKHAWSSFFAPWNAGAAIFTLQVPRFDAKKTLEAISLNKVNTLCAPPTVWRMLILEDLEKMRVPHLREVASAGEPLNPEVMERVHRAWNLWIRDGYGQTETTAQIGNSPGQNLKPGSMGQALPGYEILLLDEEGRAGRDGEISLRRNAPPVGLMSGYLASEVEEDPSEEWYRTKDTATLDEDGYYWYLGRSDDVFKSADYRISPFELESVLIEHPAVVEAAVIPSPDPLRLSVPKAFIALHPDVLPDKQVAAEILRFARTRLAPYQRIRRIEFSDLPKTISGKIRRVQLRAQERERRQSGTSHSLDFHEDELSDLLSTFENVIRVESQENS